MSLVKKSNPNTVYTAQKQNKLQQTKHRGVYQKKKKIPHTQTKTKPQQTKPSNPRSRRRSSLVVVVVVARPSSQIADRFASTPVLGAPSDPPSRYFSLFLSNSLLVSLSLYLTEMKKWNEIFADHRSVIGDRRSLYLYSGAAVLVAPSSSLALPQGFSLWLSQSLSLFISLNEIYERVSLFIL